MAQNSTNIEIVDQRTHDLVYGFIREASTCRIPEDIIHICICFYLITDRFDPNQPSKNITLDEDKQIVRPNATKVYGCFGNAYLEQIVESGCHKWRFKILGYTRMIGVWRVQKDTDPPRKLYLQRATEDMDTS